MRRTSICLLALTLAVLLLTLRSRPALATHGCASAGSPAGPFDLESYEAASWRATYARSLELAGFNQLLPDVSGFALPILESGPRSSGSTTTVAPYAPPALLKAIAWIESSWQMADSSVPYGGVGPPLLSHSCAYGVMQIVSGMQNVGQAPTLNQVHTGSHYGFNIAQGARILAQKWNLAPEFRPLIGSRNKSLVEDWYYAIWSYHGFTFTNHPVLNTNYSVTRGVYRCDGTQSYGSFPYQELILGCLKNPPIVAGTPLWSAIPVTLPNLSLPAFSLANWNSCSVDDQCAGMDFPTPTPSHSDSTTVSVQRSAVIGSPSLLVGPVDIEFYARPDSTSETVTVSVRNGGTGPMAWRLSPSVTWLQFSQIYGLELGSDLGATSAQISFVANGAGLSPGTYSGVVLVSSLYPQVTRTINVKLVVAQRSFVPGVSRG